MKERILTISDLFKTTWEELSFQEMARIIEMSDQLQLVDPDSSDHGFIVISILRLLRKNKRAVSKINIEQAVDCFNDITFFRRTAKGNFQTPWYFFPVGNFSITPPSGGKGVNFVRPEMSGVLPMFNRNFDQLVYADTAFSNFCVLNAYKVSQPEADDQVNAMIAVLYTHHLHFDISGMETKAALIAKGLTQSQKSVILHTYANVRGFIMDRCPHLFPAPPEDDEDAPVQPPQSTGPMWLNLRYDLAETEAFRGFETARGAMIYDALDYLEKKARENAKTTIQKDA